MLMIQIINLTIMVIKLMVGISLGLIRGLESLIDISVRVCMKINWRYVGNMVKRLVRRAHANV